MATVYKRTVLIGGTSEALDNIDGADLSDGDLAFVVDSSNNLYTYELDDDSGATEASPDIIEPDDNAGDKRWLLKKVPYDGTAPPVGTIVAFLGGYFGDGSNGSFTNVIGNDASTINSLVNGDGWYVCNGAALNSGGSSIFNGANRYLPNLTDDRFLMGDTSGGATGGSSTNSHTHNLNIASFTSGATTLTTTQIPSHEHTVNAYYITGSGGLQWTWDATQQATTQFSTGATGGGGSHTHSVDPPNTTSGSSTTSENRPRFLSCFYLMRVV